MRMRLVSRRWIRKASSSAKSTVPRPRRFPSSTTILGFHFLDSISCGPICAGAGMEWRLGGRRLPMRVGGPSVSTASSRSRRTIGSPASRRRTATSALAVPSRRPAPSSLASLRFLIFRLPKSNRMTSFRRRARHSCGPGCKRPVILAGPSYGTASSAPGASFGRHEPATRLVPWWPTIVLRRRPCLTHRSAPSGEVRFFLTCRSLIVRPWRWPKAMRWLPYLKRRGCIRGRSVRCGSIAYSGLRHSNSGSPDIMPSRLARSWPAAWLFALPADLLELGEYRVDVEFFGRLIFIRLGFGGAGGRLGCRQECCTLRRVVDRLFLGGAVDFEVEINLRTQPQRHGVHGLQVGCVPMGTLAYSRNGRLGGADKPHDLGVLEFRVVAHQP